MIVDSSALLAVILGEPGAARFAAMLARVSAPRIPTPNWVEVAMIVESRGDGIAKARFFSYVEEQHMLIGAFEQSHAMEARTAFERFGKGAHKAGLNFGDCMCYGFAKVEREPLLFKGDDFTHTDIEPALKG